MDVSTEMVEIHRYRLKSEKHEQLERDKGQPECQCGSTSVGRYMHATVRHKQHGKIKDNR